MNHAQRRGRIRRAAPRRERQQSPMSVADSQDLLCAVQVEVARVSARAGEHAAILESIGIQAFEAAGTLAADASASDLVRRAHETRGIVLHALAVLADLQAEVGRMQTLAAMRQALDDARQQCSATADH